MKIAEVQLPDALFDEMETIGRDLNLSVADLLRRAAENWIHDCRSTTGSEQSWRFPEARHLGKPMLPPEEWRLLAEDPAAP